LTAFKVRGSKFRVRLRASLDVVVALVLGIEVGRTRAVPHTRAACFSLWRSVTPRPPMPQSTDGYDHRSERRDACSLLLHFSFCLLPSLLQGAYADLPEFVLDRFLFFRIGGEFQGLFHLGCACFLIPLLGDCFAFASQCCGIL